MPFPTNMFARVRPVRRRTSYRPLLDPLEDRCVPATITVNTTADGDTRDAVLSLREAIRVANGDLAAASLTAGEQTQVSGAVTSPQPDTIAFNIPTPPLGAVSRWSAEKAANDSVASNQGTLRNGAAFGDGIIGQGFSFDGVDDLVTVPDAENLNAQQFTIGAWFVTSSRLSDPLAAYLVAKSGLDGLSGYELSLNERLDGATLRFALNGGGTAASADLFGPTNVADGRFHHVAATYDGQTMRIYLDGALEAQTNVQLTISYAAGRPFLIGGREHPPIPGPWTGVIDEVEFYNRPLSASEVRSQYLAGAAFLSLTRTGLVSQHRAEGNANDSGDNNPGTLLNGTTFATGKVGHAFSFDGEDDFVTVPDADNLDLNGAVTIDMWFKLRASNGVNNQVLLWKGDTNGADVSSPYWLVLDAGTNRFRFGIGSGTDAQFIDSVTAAQTNTWYHIAGVADGANVSLYVNGILETTAPQTLRARSTISYRICS